MVPVNVMRFLSLKKFFFVVILICILLISHYIVKLRNFIDSGDFCPEKLLMFGVLSTRHGWSVLYPVPRSVLLSVYRTDSSLRMIHLSVRICTDNSICTQFHDLLNSTTHPLHCNSTLLHAFYLLQCARCSVIVLVN